MALGEGKGPVHLRQADKLGTMRAVYGLSYQWSVINWMIWTARPARAARTALLQCGVIQRVTKPTDDELVQRAQQQDPEAFRLLVERYQRRLFSVALGVMRNPEDAAEIVQEAFIKAFRHIKGFQGSSSVYTWLYRIVVNLCIDQFRKRSRQQQVEYDDALNHSVEKLDTPISPSKLGIDPAKVYQRKELLEQLEKAINALSEKHRAIIMLREIEGLSYTEIAETLEISKGTVMSRLHHARKNLQLALHDYLQGKSSLD